MRLRHRTPAGIARRCATGLLACALAWPLAASALQSPDGPVPPRITVEHAPGVSAALEDGISTQVELPTSRGRFSLSGGLFFTRLAPMALGEDTTRASMTMDRITALMNGEELPTDQAIHQQLVYETHGVRVAGRYTQVGEAFAGMHALQQQFTGDERKGVGVGRTLSGYAIDYTGVSWLSLAAAQTRTTVARAGDKEDGLTRLQTSRALGLALHDRVRLDYGTTTTEDTWDARRGAIDAKTVAAETLTLSGTLGTRSTFALGQTTTDTAVGGTHGTVVQRDASLALRESPRFGLTGGYQTKETIESGEQKTSRNLAVTAKPGAGVECAAKYADGVTEKPGADPVAEQTLDVRVAHALTPAVRVAHQFRECEKTGTGATLLRGHQLTWTPAAGSTVSALLRTDVLPHAVQQRREARCALADANGTGTLTGVYGEYACAAEDNTVREADLFSVAATAQPAPRCSVALGYYAGPLLAMSEMTYRTWGDKLKPRGSADVWKDEDFTRYEEYGGALTCEPLPGTTVSVARAEGTLDDADAYETLTCTVAQDFGGLALERGQRVTETLTAEGPAAAEERWWTVRSGAPGPLPAWTANSLKYAPVANGAAWGLGQAPAWATAPKPGLSLSRRYAESGDTAVDAYSARLAGMAAPQVFFQVAYDQHPEDPKKKGQREPVQRGLFHVAYALNPALQCYGRVVYEARTDEPWAQQTQTVGVAGKLSQNDTVQAQLESCTRDDHGTRLDGTACVLAYERTVADAHTLTLRYRLTPEEFTTPENRVRLEGSYRLVF